MRCHEVDYEIIGNSMQMVEVELDPGEVVIAEAGAMNYMEDDISFKSKMGDGSDVDAGFFGKLMGAGKRMLTGESIFMTHFRHEGNSQKRRVCFAAPYPGTVIPLDMADIGGVTCQKDAFLCAAFGTKVSITLNRRIGTGFFGGEGFILQRLEGDGMAFLHAGGTVVKRDLQAGETLRLDTGCLVGFSDGVDYRIEMVKGLKSAFFGGEGLFLATLSGPGSVWMQSLPFSRLADRVIQSASGLGGNKGEGSVLGGLGDLIDGR